MKTIFYYILSIIFLVAITIITIKIRTIIPQYRQLRDDNIALLETLKNDVAELKTLKEDIASGVLDAAKKDYEKLAGLLVTYSAYNLQNNPLKLYRHGKDGDGGYVTPEEAFKAADVLLGYGIAGDISFEEQFSEIYKKPSYGFDCGIKSIDSKNVAFTFIDQCIGTDKTLYNVKDSSHNVTSFSQQLANLGLKDKKIFIKMDIEGAEYGAFEDIYKYAPQITGIVMELHIFGNDEARKAVRLLSNINKDFILVHIHGNGCATKFFSSPHAIGLVPRWLELTYINKSLVSKYNISENQTYPTSLDMSQCPNAEVNEFTILTNSK